MPGGKHEVMRGWSPEEDQLLLELIQTSGKRWKLIADALGRCAGTGKPRTPAMVRNRFLRIERGRWLTEQGMSKNRCGQCGQLKRGHVCQAPRALVATSFQAQEAMHEAVRLQHGDAPPTDGAAGAIHPIAVPAACTPPSLRTQGSMEILALASETHLQAMLCEGGDEMLVAEEVPPDAAGAASSSAPPSAASAPIPIGAPSRADPPVALPTTEALAPASSKLASCATTSDTVSHTSATSIEA